MGWKTATVIAVILNPYPLLAERVLTYVFNQEVGDTSELDTLGRTNDSREYLNKELLEPSTKYAIIKITPRDNADRVNIEQLETDGKLTLLQYSDFRTEFVRGELQTTRETTIVSNGPRDLYRVWTSSG